VRQKFVAIAMLLAAALMVCGLARANAPVRPIEQPSPTPEAETPVLVQHLPNWESVGKQASYVVTLDGLKAVVPNQPIIDSIDFEGGTEAAAANYGQAQLVIIEFATPQFSVENDQRIAAKIQELKNLSQPIPTAYRRVGNYSVFVFHGTDAASANQLIDEVKYQKVVQWLGEDPHLYARLQRYFTETSAGVLVAVLKSSGLSLIACLAIGGLFGFLLFRHRRAQKATVFSDAGGQVRLNLDDLTGAPDPSRLIESGRRPSQLGKP
jgi:hypothetical protein